MQSERENFFPPKSFNKTVYNGSGNVCIAKSCLTPKKQPTKKQLLCVPLPLPRQITNFHTNMPDHTAFGKINCAPWNIQHTPKMKGHWKDKRRENRHLKVNLLS